MNTKTFAQESRKILMQGVAKKLLYWGFTEKGEVLEKPQKISGGFSFRGEVFDDTSVPNLWDSLSLAVKQKGIDVVIEEAAYTWFNRMMALHILAKNGYEESQLENAKGLEHTPLILQKARQGQFLFLNAEEKTRLQKVITDYNKDQEAFAILIKGYCHSHNTLNRVFGRLDDYTELLLPDNMLQDGGFLHLLNTTDAISDEDYQTVELIGWLYQFYISEKKDEVFASFKKNKKAEAKDIPAATQIFTPNWIVKYMVENTAGKIWLDKHPDSALKTQMKYLVENESDGQNKAIISDIEELTIIDPACGSGHILVEGFDLLYQMYMEEYYTSEEAVASILKNNLFGLDIDDRAAQLATFAILLKAAKKYRDIWQKDWLPNVYAMPEAQDFSLQEVKDFLGTEGTEFAEELEAALSLMKQAKNLGSVMKLNVNEEARTFIEQRFAELEHTDYRDFNIEAIYQNLKAYIPVLLILTNKYTSVVANPPYMGSKNMNSVLKGYVAKNYPEAKRDLFTTFMFSSLNILNYNGMLGMINLPSWLYLSSFEKFRFKLLKRTQIISLLDFGRGVFGSDFGSVAFVLKNNNTSSSIPGKYYRFYKNKSTVKNSLFKKDQFLSQKLSIYSASQMNFQTIPNCPISYWVPSKVISIFEDASKLDLFANPRQGLATGDNPRFLRFWSEVDYSQIGFCFRSVEHAHSSEKQWFPYNKGGVFRKWYGNFELILRFDPQSFDVLSNQGNHLPSREFYFKSGFTWSDVTISKFSNRVLEKGYLFDTAGPVGFTEDENTTLYLSGLLNSVCAQIFFNILMPTIHFNCGDMRKFPVIWDNEREALIIRIVNECLSISKKDWDSRETSWDFEQSPLLNETNSLKQAVQTWQDQVAKEFFQLHTNEEELNRIFIDIYGLQEELSPEVALKDITILQEELNKKDMEALEETFRAQVKESITLPIDRSEVISQFISYAIGLFMGRYRLDKPGLNIAHPNPSAEELASYTHNGGQVIIDEDAILPLMGKNCNFPDDGLQQIYSLLDAIWGPETRTENINFIQECLNKDLEKFLVKDFYKYHCGMYKKKPIFWLFSSKKGGFQVLVYMHRMNAFTVEKIRANYLLEHLKNLQSEIHILESDAANLNTSESKHLDNLRKQLQECEAYDIELKDMADQQITFDLDDGVTVNYKKFESIVAKIK